MSDVAFYNLVLAMTEAVVNAIVHGNLENPEKMVGMEVVCREDGVHCMVSDQGSGFSPDEVADPMAPENLLKDGGRGVFIIRAVSRSFDVESTEEGTTMRFVIDRREGAASDPEDDNEVSSS